MFESRRRARATWIVVGAAVLAITWLLRGWSDGQSGAGPDVRPAQVAGDPALLEGAQASTRPVLRAPGRDPDSADVKQGPVRIQVVNQHQVPIAGVEVALLRDAADASTIEAPHVLTTDAQGRAVFADVPYDGFHVVAPARLMRRWFVEGEAKEGTRSKNYHLAQAVSGPQMVVKIAALPLDVRVPAGVSGKPILGLPIEASPLYVGRDWKTGDQQPMWVRADVRVDGGPLVVIPRNAVPPGAHACEPIQDTPISPAARSLVAVVPLLPEAKLAMPTSNASWTHVALIDGTHLEYVRFDAAGGGTLLGVPYRPGMQVSVLAHSNSDDSSVPVKRFWADLTLDGDAQTQHVLRLAPLDLSGRKELAERIVRVRAAAEAGDPPVRAMVVTADAQSDAPWGAAMGEPTSGHVEVRVYSSDGRPAIGTHVRIARRSAKTDSVGRVVLSDLSAETTRVSVWGAGPAWQESVVIADVKRQVVHVRVPAAARVDLEVVDEAGRPVSYADIEVTSDLIYPWCDMHDGEQRIDWFVDVNGRRRLHNLTPTVPLTLAVRSGVYRGHKRVVLPPGSSQTIRIQVKRPAAPLDRDVEERARKKIEQAIAEWPTASGK